MKFNLSKFKIQKLDFKQDQGDNELTNKQIQEIFIKDNLQILNSPKIVQLQTITAELQNIPGATTQDENVKLPQEALYDFSFNLPVPETYLPFFNIELISDLDLVLPEDFDDTGAPIREVIGVGEFEYSSLREISVQLYDWKGVTNVTAGAGSFGGFTDIPLSAPHVGLPSFSLIVPAPTDCYNTDVFWSAVSFPLIGSGINNIPTDRTGSILFPGTPSETSLSDYTQNLADIWNITSTSVVFGATQTIDFKFESIDFPVPFNPDNPDEFTVPCGSTDPDEDSTIENPDQYWESQGFVTFQELIDTKGYTYQEAKNIIQGSYPTIFITPESEGEPFKAYTRQESTVIETARQNIQIIQNSENNYTVNVFGHLLLTSIANKETDFSDEDFPTFEPDGKPPSITLKVFFINHPVIQNQRKFYRNG